MPFDNDKFYGTASHADVGNLILENRQIVIAVKAAIRILAVKAGHLDPDIVELTDELAVIDKRLDKMFRELTGYTE